MKENESALYSEYMIDGIRCEATPAELLMECMRQIPEFQDTEEEYDDIIDESIEPPLSPFTYDDSLKEVYLNLTSKTDPDSRVFRMLYPEHFTRLRAAASLIDRIWNDGHFRLGDLSICAAWEWNTRPVGSMAAFYASASSLSSYLYDLGIRIEGVEFHESDTQSHLTIQSWLHEDTVQDFKSSPYESTHPWISEDRKCPDTVQHSSNSWLIFIPFDTCRFKLGGSMLAESMDQNGEAAPSLNDPDYFIDCYEVVRELIEDGIVTSGVTVADGGLLTAADRLCKGSGADLDVTGLMSSYQAENQTKVLFGEVPGVLIQIEDQDYDYVDSQLTLQDVAYYPLGHPADSHLGVRIEASGKSGVADILSSLLGQASEGED